MLRSQMVAVVDDDRSIRDAVFDLLQVEGYPARTFGDGPSLLDDAALGEIACVITDVRMPAMNGLELQRQLKERAPALPVIFITSSADEDMRARALADGALAWLAKPVSDADLLAQVRLALGEPGPEFDLQSGS